MAESSHDGDRLSRNEERVKCFVCSRRFLDPRLLSCHHTFCKACLRCFVINDSVACPECQAVLNLSADGLEGLPSSPRIIHLLKIVNAQESAQISLAIRERHARDRNLHYGTLDIDMVTPSRTASGEDVITVTDSRTDSDDRHGDVAMVTSPMPVYAERRGTVFIDCGTFLNGRPLCIAVSPAADRLYVTDCDYHTVLIFDDRGKLMKTAYGPDVRSGVSPRGGAFWLGGPTGIAVNKDGDVIVSDRDIHRVVVLSRDGEYKFSFGTHGEKDGQFDMPVGVAVDDACSIYVCDWCNHRVQVFTRDGGYLRTFKKPDNVSGEFRPLYLAIARTTGHVHVTDSDHHRVYMYTPLGQCMTCFGPACLGVGEMLNPSGICVDDDGRLLIADTVNHRVQVFNGDGTFHCTLVLARDTPWLAWPLGLTIDKTGRVFVVDADSARVLVF